METPNDKHANTIPRPTAILEYGAYVENTLSAWFKKGIALAQCGVLGLFIGLLLNWLVAPVVAPPSWMVEGYLSSQAATLNWASHVAYSNDHPETGRKWGIKATQVYLRLTEDKPHIYRAMVADSAEHVIDCLEMEGLSVQALDIARKVVDIRRALVFMDKDAHLPALTRSLINLAAKLESNGLEAEARAVAAEVRQILDLDTDTTFETADVNRHSLTIGTRRQAA